MKKQFKKLVIQGFIITIMITFPEALLADSSSNSYDLPKYEAALDKATEKLSRAEKEKLVDEVEIIYKEVLARAYSAKSAADFILKYQDATLRDIVEFVEKKHLKEKEGWKGYLRLLEKNPKNTKTLRSDISSSFVQRGAEITYLGHRTVRPIVDKMIQDKIDQETAKTDPGE